MPEEKNPMRISSQEPGPIYNVGEAFYDWAKQCVVVVGVILQIRILNKKVVSSGMGDPGVNGGALPFVYVMYKIFYPLRGVLRNIILCDLFRIVGRTVVDNDYLLFYLFCQLYLIDPIQYSGDEFFFIEGRYDNGEPGRFSFPGYQRRCDIDKMIPAYNLLGYLCHSVDNF